MARRTRVFLAALVFATFARPGFAGPAGRQATALTGGKVVAAPGKVFDPGVVVLRGAVIEAVGPAGSTPIPADASVVDVTGKVVHASFIDAYVTTDRLAGKPPKRPPEDGAKAPAPVPPAVGPAAHPVGAVRADVRALDGLTVDEDVAGQFRAQGFGIVAAVPTAGVFRGQGAVVTLSDGPWTGRVVDPANGQIVAMRGLDENEYPTSNMGAVAVTRQALSDALWWRDAEAAYAASPSGKTRPPFVAATAALVPAAEGREVVVFETADVLGLLRAMRVARETRIQGRFVAGDDAYRLLKEVAAGNPDLVVRVAFPQPDKLDREEEWLDVSTARLRAYDRAPSNPRWLRDAGLSFSLTTDGLEKVGDFSTRVREAISRGLSEDDALAAVTTIPARQLGLSDRVGSLAPGMAANLVVRTAAPFDSRSTVTEIWIDGSRTPILGADKKDSPARAFAADVRPAPPREAGPAAAPPAVVVRGATVWTQGPAGRLENADLLVVAGKVAAVGPSLAAPSGALEIDGRGKHVTPGIVDAHSHSAIDDSTNEGTHNVTAEVRIRDVLTPFEPSIYRELAGGTTVANVLHGSANSIGGQNQIVKWRRGGGPDELVFVGAPEGIKFALGENPKQSNWNNPKPRYPATRMGVADSIQERFQAAKDYRASQAEYRKASAAKGSRPIPPRPDLQLEAIAEILEGKRQIHCHSYRKDEILQMIRSAEQAGVKIATFQHVLEGYKVADEIARHGAGASGFSDWWAYKVEVYDAIPWAFPLMRERGVLVSFNSDSDELARRLNLEAAKAVKYGNVRPEDALAFVTSNPAKQLGIANRVGSLEAGKDGDFVVWSGDPLSTGSMALETWIEGTKYFDRAADLAARPGLEAERAALVAKAKARIEAGGTPEKAAEPGKPGGGR